MLQAQKKSTSSRSDFLKTENKGKLWSMLQSNGAFNGISNNFFSKVREDFEAAAVRIEEDHTDKPKMQKNKLFLDFMVRRMDEYKRQSYTQPYTADQIKKSRQEAFQNALSQKQNEFQVFNSKPQPPDINLADKEDDSNGNVNDLLEKAIRDRDSLTIPPPISRSENSSIPISQSTSNLDDVGEEVVKEGQVSQVSQIEVDPSLLNTILEKLNTIEDLLRNKNKNM